MTEPNENWRLSPQGLPLNKNSVPDEGSKPQGEIRAGIAGVLGNAAENTAGGLADQLNIQFKNISFILGEELHSHKTEPALVIIDLKEGNFCATLDRNPVKGNIDFDEFKGIRFTISFGKTPVVNGTVGKRNTFWYQVSKENNKKEVTITFSDPL